MMKNKIIYNRQNFRENLRHSLMGFLAKHEGENIGDWFLIIDLVNLQFKFDQPAIPQFSPFNIPVTQLFTIDENEDEESFGSVIVDEKSFDELVNEAFEYINRQIMLN